MSAAHITIDMDAKCAECGKGGAVTRVSVDSEDDPGCGLCMKCVTKALDGNGKLKSWQAKAVRLRGRQPLPKLAEQLK